MAIFAPDLQQTSPTDADDVLFGSQVGELIAGFAGDDQLFGLGGDDDGLVGFAGDDELHGGSGDDLLDGSGDDEPPDDDDQLFGDSGDDNLLGGPGDDHLVGGNGNDRLNGQAGNDELNGGSGDDILRGDDRVAGLPVDGGNDQLFGGSGADTFEFVFAPEEVPSQGNDTIEDFEPGVDRIFVAGLSEGLDSNNDLQIGAGDDRVSVDSNGQKSSGHRFHRRAAG